MSENCVSAMKRYTGDKMSGTTTEILGYYRKNYAYRPTSVTSHSHITSLSTLLELELQERSLVKCIELKQA